MVTAILILVAVLVLVVIVGLACFAFDERNGLVNRIYFMQSATNLASLFCALLGAIFEGFSGSSS